MKKGIMILLGMFVLALYGCGFAGNQEAKRSAVDSAILWLEKVDAGKYGQTWEEAATYFKSAVPKSKWSRTIQMVRQPLGQTISREVFSKKYRTSIPGAPDGEYVIVQFKTVFAHKKEAIETITPMLDSDGMWRVSGYYIK